MRQRNKTKHAQVSFEFIMIFTLVLFAIMGFTFIVKEKLFELSEKHDQLVLEKFADNIVNEVVLASRVNNNYVRKFNIPVKLLGRDYKVNINEDEFMINVYENENIILSYFTIFPVSVKGNFIDNVTFNTSQHCISKSDMDGIRISRTQSSLDVNKTQYLEGEEVEITVSFHCVEDMRSGRFTVRYDDAKLEFKRAEPVVRRIRKYRDKNPLFDDITFEYPFQDGSEWILPGRFTFGYIGTECVSGSGNFAKLFFEVKEDSALGETYIEFDDNVDAYLNVLDCYTDANTIDYLPDSINNAKIEIIDIT